MASPNDPFEEIGQLFEQFTGPLTGDIPVDILETDTQVVVLADLPGRDSEDIDVRLEDDHVLHIEAPAPDDDVEGEYVLRGRHRDRTRREVTLPSPVVDDETSATYDRGVLTIRLGKPGDGEGTDIPVS